MNGLSKSAIGSAKPLIPQGEELARPPTRLMVIVSLVAAFLLTVLPWPQAALWLVPDFALLVLIYWNIHAPRLAALGAAFALGLAMDAAHGVLFGLHALSYCVATFVVLMLRRRLDFFTAKGQALHLAPIFPLQEALVLLLGLAYGHGEADWRYLAAGIVTAALWMPASFVLDRLTGRPTRLDKVRGG
ncbi:MAG: rod shape-determining protein MreD [Hydrogenophilaceae bacterium]|nr:rod shape-determining protein MreD [Hydrogenophilaceae bacterium]